MSSLAEALTLAARKWGSGQNGEARIEQVHQTMVSILIKSVLREKRCAKEYGCDDPLHCLPRMSGSCRWWNMKNVLLESMTEITFPALLGSPPEYQFSDPTLRRM